MERKGYAKKWITFEEAAEEESYYSASIGPSHESRIINKDKHNLVNTRNESNSEASRDMPGETCQALISPENANKEIKRAMNSQHCGAQSLNRSVNGDDSYLDPHTELGTEINCLYTNADSLMNKREELIANINQYGSDSSGKRNFAKYYQRPNPGL